MFESHAPCAATSASAAFWPTETARPLNSARRHPQGPRCRRRCQSAGNIAPIATCGRGPPCHPAHRPSGSIGQPRAAGGIHPPWCARVGARARVCARAGMGVHAWACMRGRACVGARVWVRGRVRACVSHNIAPAPHGRWTAPRCGCGVASQADRRGHCGADRLWESTQRGTCAVAAQMWGGFRCVSAVTAQM